MATTTKHAKTNKITLTPELSAALRQAYFCCREIGGRNQSDYEIESMQAADQIRKALQSAGLDPEAGS